jgi:hypothetical protein
MALVSEGTTEVVCAAAGLHAYETGRCCGHVLEQLRPRQLLPPDNLPVLIHRDQMENRFAEVDTDNIHWSLLISFHPRIVAQMETLRQTISLRLELAGMRKDVAFACGEFRVSECRGCKLMGADRGTVRYEPRPDHNPTLREALIVLARRKPRYGYRLLHVLLEKRGHAASVMRIYRLYRAEGLTVRRLRRKPVVARGCSIPSCTSQWALDFAARWRTVEGFACSLWWTPSREKTFPYKWTRGCRAVE